MCAALISGRYHPRRRPPAPIRVATTVALGPDWRHDEHADAANRFLGYLPRHRDQHAWITDPMSRR